MYEKTLSEQREALLRQKLGDEIYNILGEVGKMEKKHAAIVCPKCNAVNFREAKVGDVIRCKACEETFILDAYRYFCPDCEMYFFTKNEDMPVCPTCHKLGFLTKLNDLPEGEFKGRLEAQMKECDPNGIDQHKAGAKIFNTGINTKRENWPKFAELIENQFKHGGEKYLLDNQKDKEFTDLVCEVSPGKTGFDWILQTCVKYIGRYLNFQRERDLLKIATYCYIAWLKAGHHVTKDHDEDIQLQKKDVEEME